MVVIRIHGRIVINACVKYQKQIFIGVQIRTDKIFKYFGNLSKQKWREVYHSEFDPHQNFQDSWGKCSLCICKVSETNMHWCLIYSSGRTKFSNILAIWANKNGYKLAILNLILATLHTKHGRIVVNACAKYRKKIFIGVGDMHPAGQHFQILCQFEQTKWWLVGHFEFDPDNFHRIHGRIVLNACVKYG